MDTSHAPRSAGGTNMAMFAAAETEPPEVSPDQAARVAETVFGVTGPITELGSQQDRNFRIDAADGCYVLKVANPAVPEVQLACQNAAMEHLARGGVTVPRPCPAASGATLERARIGDADLLVRLLTFLDGTPLASFGYLSPAVRGRPGGLIDFGDITRSWVVSELAVTCAAILHQMGGDPLGWLPAVAAFHGIVPLDDADVAALWPLVVLRGATLVAADERQLALDPQNDYVAGNLENDLLIFESSASLPWALAEAAIREALGLGGGTRAVPHLAPMVSG